MKTSLTGVMSSQNVATLWQDSKTLALDKKTRKVNWSGNISYTAKFLALVDISRHKLLFTP